MSAGDGVARLLFLADATEDEQNAAIERAGRGVAEVDRAVRRFRSGHVAPVHVGLALASALRWPLCGCGRGGIRPGACVKFRGLLWHAECAVEKAREDAHDAPAAA